MKRFMVVSYDISDDRRRLKIMKALQDFGTRVQYSVFECNLHANELQRLKRRLRPWVQGEDSVRFYFINAADVTLIEVMGSGAVTREQTFYLH